MKKISINKARDALNNCKYPNNEVIEAFIIVYPASFNRICNKFGYFKKEKE